MCLPYLKFSDPLTETHLFFIWPYRKLELPKSALNEADQKDFEVQGYGFDADKEELRSARVVRVGLIQNKILIPTTAPISEQVDLLLMIYFQGSHRLEMYLNIHGFLEKSLKIKSALKSTRKSL